MKKTLVLTEMIDLTTSARRPALVTLEVKDMPTLGTCVFMQGGPTGYESFVAKPDVLSTLVEKGWIACSGTPGRWERLVIPAEDMTKALTELGLWSTFKCDCCNAPGIRMDGPQDGVCKCRQSNPWART